MNRDEEHLNLLGIANFVVGGLLGLCSCFPVLHLVLGLGILVSPESFNDGQNPPPAALGFVFMLIPLVIIIAGWAFAGAVIYAGRCLRRRERHTFCLVMAVILCTFMPFGTVVGVLTIVLLLRPNVKELFGVAAAQ